MLAKHLSIKQQRDIRYVYNKGRSSSSKDLRIKYCKNKLSYSRFVFVVSNKISKKAVVRNKIRRRLKAIIYHNLDKFLGNYDIIISVRQTPINRSYQEIEAELKSVLRRGRLIKDI